MKEVIAKPGQTILDVALEQYGSAEGMRYILEDNPDLEVENLESGDIVNVRDSVLDKDIKKLFVNQPPASE